MRSACLVLAFLAMAAMTPSAEPVQSSAAKPTILVHLTSGPENPTRAALAFLVARTASEQGHAVSMFLAGDAVQLLRDDYDVIAKAGGRFYLSGMSSGARGVTAADLQGKPAELAPPAVLLKLALENDRMFTY
jgi:predicted peroxiredoxin